MNPASSAARMDALQETVTTLMKQLQAQGSKLMDMELREQKLLTDLKGKCDKVLELQMAVDAREDNAQAVARATRKEKQLRVTNEVS